MTDIVGLSGAGVLIRFEAVGSMKVDASGTGKPIRTRAMGGVMTCG